MIELAVFDIAGTTVHDGDFADGVRRRASPPDPGDHRRDAREFQPPDARLWTVPGVLDSVATSDEVAHGRPHPDMICHLMASLGIPDPSRVAKVGNTRAELEEGTGAGCGLVIGVTTGSR